MHRSRIFLADDHKILLAAFRKILEPEFEIIGVASDGRELLSSAAGSAPDLIIVDLGLPLLNGMDAGRRLRELLPNSRFLVVTMNEDPEVAFQVLAEWASGFLLKTCGTAELLHAIREVLAGRTYVTAEVLARFDEQNAEHPAHLHSSLTFRQREVLQLLAEGCNMKEAASILDITRRTVAYHKYKLMRDLSLQNSSDLIRLAVEEHMIVSS
jgi:DNA-binding NarL/FixJ family response regulator